MREAKFAGLFYEKTEPALRRQLEACFTDEKGPGSLPSKQTEKMLKGVIVPHAGYKYSGPCAAWAYKVIAESETPDLFILIGPSHHYENSGFSAETFETPLGLMRVHQDFAREIAKKGHISQNEVIHVDEHSLEVQIPFLQYIYKKDAERIKVFPLLLSHDADIDNIVVDIKETLMEMNLKATFIISSDFTHYGPNYRYVPFSTDVKKNIYDLDRGAIELIKAMNAKEFNAYVDKNLMTVCGALPIYLLLKTIKSDKVLLEQYYTSGDVVDDYRNSVSYASFVFK